MQVPGQVFSAVENSKGIYRDAKHSSGQEANIASPSAD